MKAYVDLDLGQLDDNHIFCISCGEVVCFNVRDPLNKVGTCRSCGVVMSETHQKKDDGVGRIQWIERDARGGVVNGGTI
jgi:hypothetical protein